MYTWVYVMALSEPLFLTLLLAACLSLAQSFDREHWGWPALTGVLLSLATLTRYAGASLFIPVLLAFALLKTEHWPPPSGRFSLRTDPLRAIALLLAGASLPILAWMGYNLAFSQAGSFGNRRLIWHPIPLTTLFEGIKNLLTWLAPDGLLTAHRLWGWLLSLFALLLLPGLLAWLGWVLWRRWHSRPALPSNGGLALAFGLALHILTYLGFLIVSLSFFDATTPLNDRILSVVYVPEIILFASTLAWLWRNLGQRAAALRGLVALFCAGLALASLSDGVAAVRDLSRDGLGFANQGLRESPAIQSIRDLPATTVIYSNKPGAIFLLAGKSAYVAPTPTDPVTTQARANYASDLAQMQARLLQGQAVLVLFGLRNSSDPAEATLFDDLSAGMPVLADYGNAVIFGRLP
jgi:4-amino-4-deoxy-L-arabinose transferase-like glycosyltransferase